MKSVTISLLFIFLLSCHSGRPHTPANSLSGIESGMRHYDSLLRKMDADSIAWIFTPDGQLGTIARGRDSIRRFLNTFKNVRVLAISSLTKNITLTADSATQTGTYTQTALVNNKDTLHLKGSFEAHWRWLDGEGWKIARMLTHPE